MPLAHSASGTGGPTHAAPHSSGTNTSSASHSLSDNLLLSLRQKPNARLFRTLFQYIPIRDSPNENPQLELPLQAGEYILVHGEMDEDQFYHGETLDGQTGLVPSNYVERITDQRLFSNAYRAPSPSFPLSVPPHLAQIPHDFSESSNQPLPDSVCPYPPVDVSKVAVQEIKQTDIPRVPFPRELVIEKKMSRSVVLSWSVPDDCLTPISQYHVCVDGVVRAVVPGSFKCKALIEDIDLSKAINISVRAVIESGHSPDAACTIALGKDAPIAPQHVRIWSITPVAAIVSWYPSDSNVEHIILLNAVKVGVCPPSVFQVQLSGLSPSTIYRVSVRTKHPKAVLEQRPVERCVDFKTLPKIGLPDPPTNVQVEMGPQPGTLLVSWCPVSTQPLPPSRAAVHSYLVYADGRNIAQIPGADADHVLLRLSDFADDLPIFITVRTRTKEGAVSSDSNVSRVPRSLSVNPSGTLGATKTLCLSGPASTSLVQPHKSIMMPAIPSSSTAAILQNPHRATLGLSNNQLSLNQSSYPGNLPLGSHTTSLLSNQQYGSLPGPSALTGIPVMQTGDPIVHLSGQTAVLNAIQVPTSAALNTYGAIGLTNSLSTSAEGQKPAFIPSSGILLDDVSKVYQTGTAQEWKSQNQYYTFHPKSLCREVSTADEKPSVLEMEHNYLLKHRAAQWPAVTHSSRPRLEHYVRGRVDERISLMGRLTGAFPFRGHLTTPLARLRMEEMCSTRSEPDLRPVALDDYNCRWFVALFDYSHHMSPNANAQQEELSFRKHQLIKVFGEVDQDGFYTGQIGHRIGLVPSNMVIEIAKDDLMPQRRRSDALPEPSIRRMRWGSLKSRSYDHAGDRRSNHKQGIEAEYYSSLERRDHSLPSRPQDYFISRRLHDARNQMIIPSRGDYMLKPDHQRIDYRAERDDVYEPYPNGRHPRDYFAYPREYRSQDKERTEYYMDERDMQERDRRDYYKDERDLPDLDRRDIRELKDTREYRDQRDLRDVRDVRDLRDSRDYRDTREFREGRYVREQNLGRRDREHLDDREDHRARDYKDVREYREQRESRDIDYRERERDRNDRDRDREADIMKHDERSYGVGRDLPVQRSYDRRDREYARIDKSQESYRENQTVQSQSQQRYPETSAVIEESRYGRTNGENLAVRKFVAKFDYDSRQLSPNVDAEQVELSFHAGDVITVYGEMDEDGFYMGELNGIRGLVPSNFLHISPPNSLLPPQMPLSQGVQQPPQPVPPISVPALADQSKVKGVAFQEAVKKSMPGRQTSQTSTRPTASIAKAVPKAGNITAPKALSKKPSDVGAKSAPNARKTSQASKKSESGVKKK